MKGVVSMMHRPIRGQGALEYLLLIGGAVLVGTVVLLIVIGSSSSGKGIINDNLDNFGSELSIHAAFGGGGGGGPACDNDGIQESGEECDGTDFGSQSCSSFGFSAGSLSCSSCTISTSSCSNPASPPVATFSMATGPSANQILTSYSVTSSYQSGQTYETIFDDVTLSGISSVAQFNAHCGSNSCLFGGVISLPNAPSSLSGVSVNFPAPSTSYWGIMKVCNSNGCNLTSMATAQSGVMVGPISFSSFTVSPPSSPSAGSVNYDFTWAVGSACASGTGVSGSAIVMGANTVLPSGTGLKSTVEGAAFNISDESSPSTYVFVPSSGSATGRAFGDSLKLVALGGETNPSFGIACEDAGATNYLLQSAVINSTYPLDSDAPVTPSAPVVTSGSTNGGVISFSGTTTADRYLGSTLSSLLVNQTNVQVACDTTLMNTPALVDAAIVAGKTVGYTNQFSGTALNSLLNYTQNLVPSQTYRCAMRSCDKVDGIITNTANCSYSTSTPTVIASKEALMWEAESPSSSSGSSVETASYLGDQVRQTVGAGCVPGTVFVDMPVTINSPSSTNTPFYVWIKAANTNATSRRYATVSIGAVNKLIQVNQSTATLTWVSALSLPVNWTGGNQTVRIEFTDNAEVQVCNAPDLKIDKVLITSQAPGVGVGQCTPTGDGSNCI
jgi:hypothetical protein